MIMNMYIVIIMCDKLNYMLEYTYLLNSNYNKQIIYYQQWMSWLP